MNHIINPWVFYWISVADVVRFIALLAAFVFGFATIAFIVYALDDTSEGEEAKVAKHYAKIMGIIFSISITLMIFIPSEDTCYKMLAADMFTQENIDAASDYVTDVIDYAVDKVKELNQGEK